MSKNNKKLIFKKKCRRKSYHTLVSICIGDFSRLAHHILELCPAENENRELRDDISATRHNTVFCRTSNSGVDHTCVIFNESIFGTIFTISSLGAKKHATSGVKHARRAEKRARRAKKRARKAKTKQGRLLLDPAGQVLNLQSVAGSVRATASTTA